MPLSFVAPHAFPRAQTHRSFITPLFPHQDRTAREHAVHPRCAVKNATTTAPPATIPPPDASLRLRTTAQSWVDPRGKRWQFPVDVIPPESVTTPPLPPIVLLHIAGGVGVDRRYWDRFLSLLHTSPVLRRHTILRFDYVGTGESAPLPTELPSPYTAAFFAAQLLAVLEAHAARQGILVAQGASEYVALRFAELHPRRVAAVIASGGASTAGLSGKPGRLSRWAYTLLSSGFGAVFWRLVQRRPYLRAFSEKNLFVDTHWLPAWVDIVADGASNPLTRFVFFSFASRAFYDDYTPILRALPMPYFFLANERLPLRSLARKTRSVRPPVPGSASEGVFGDDRGERLRLREGLVPKFEGVVVPDGGPELMFEQAEVGMREVERIVSKLYG